jgi:hypothetical protein
MNDHTNHSDGPGHHRNRVRLAYTLNNEQPVRCTLVSEEPLFYLDAPVIEDDDMMNMAHDFLGEFFETETLESALTPVLEHGAEHAIELFKSQFAKMPGTVQTPISNTRARLEQSRMGTALMACLDQYQVHVVQGDQIAPILYNRTKNKIECRANLPEIEQLLLLVRESRRVWQHHQGALLHPLMFHPDHAIIINRIQAADMMVSLVRVAWELRLAGDFEAWQYLNDHGYDDLTRSFAREAGLDFRALNNGRASAAVFESWFLSERCRMFDRTLIQQMLADYQGYMHTAGHAETSHLLTNQLIAALGTMPYGSNYLSPYTATILADPIFTEVRDRSNANFLWFIKFEQSFRQTERDMGMDQPEEHKKSATILLYPELQRVSLPLPSDQVSGTGGTVVDITRFKK